MSDDNEVPSWAMSMVGNYRRSCNVRSTATDKQVFDAIEECKGMMPNDIEEHVRDLLGSV